MRHNAECLETKLKARLRYPLLILLLAEQLLGPKSDRHQVIVEGRCATDTFRSDAKHIAVAAAPGRAG